VADDEDRVESVFWTLYFVAVAASILVLGAVAVAGLARASTIVEKLATAVLGTAAIAFIIWFYVVRPATSD
jgi:hypothetical protein